MSTEYTATQILVNDSPKEILIGYNYGSLMAYSGCCTILVTYNFDSDIWLCSGCHMDLKIQPFDDRMGPARLPSVYQLESPSTLMVIVEWIHRWTGFDLEDIKVVIE